MTPKTFSSRANEQDLAYADAVAREQFGMSFGQYCGSVPMHAMRQGVELPSAPNASPLERKASAIETIKRISKLPHDADVGRMSGDQIRGLIASRYE